MDTLFERRELTKKVNIHSRFLQQNIQASLLAQLKHQFQDNMQLNLKHLVWQLYQHHHYQ